MEICRSTKKDILFVGNDGFRDFKLVEDIINSLPEINFSIVSESIQKENLNIIILRYTEVVGAIQL